MNAFTVGDLQELLSARKGPCVSIFLPTRRAPDGAAQDRIRFKNVVDEARRKLTAVLAPRAVPRLLAPLEPLLDQAFWRDQLDGVAVFLASDFLRHWRLPMDVAERVVVADNFHVRPLIRWLQSDRRWYLLSLSANRAAFYEGSPTGLRKKSVPGMPSTPEEADVAPAQRPGVSSHSAGGGRIVFHGGSGEGSERADMARWFREIDVAVRRMLRDEHAPLLLAGVTRAQSLYRAASRYPHLVADGVDGSFARANDGEIFQRAAPVAEAAFHAREEEAVAEHQRLNGAMRSSDDLEVIASAAVEGRVRRLLIARGRTVRGVLDRSTGAVGKRAAREDAYGDDVLDDLAEAVIARGGDVLVVEKERMPSKSPVAAVLRW